MAALESNPLYSSPTYLEDVSWVAEYARSFFGGKSVLVAGASGLLGSFTADVLGCAGAEVLAVGRSRRRSEARFSGSPWTPRLIEADIMEPIGLTETAEHVIHAASAASPSAIMASPTSVIRENVCGTLNLLDWSRSHGCQRFLYVSSGEAYGVMPVSSAPFREVEQGFVDPLVPRSCYPVAKRAAESACASYVREYGLEAVVVRPCHTYGATMTPSDDRVASQLLRDAALGRRLALRSPGAQVRSWLHVADCCLGLLLALTRGTSGAAYNVASRGCICSIAELARAIATAGDVEVDVPNAPSDAGIDDTPIMRQVLDPSALEALGWRAHYGIEDGVAAAITALREVAGLESR